MATGGLQRSVAEVIRRHVVSASSVPAGIGTACVELLAVDGAAVLLMADSGAPWQVASPVGRLAPQLDEAQRTVGEGPALDAYRSGGPVLVSDVAAMAGRWPGFTSIVPAAVQALFAFPLQLGAVKFGVLEMYRCSPGGWDGAQLGLALQLADCAAEALILNVGAAPDDALHWLKRLPGKAPEIDQAAGMSSVHLGVSLTVAYARLRGYAFGTGQSLATVSQGVVAGRLRLNDDGPRAAGQVE